MSPRPLPYEPLTPARWFELETLFGPSGACAGCWCMFWRLTGAEFAKASGAPNRRAFRSLVRRGRVPGFLGYWRGEAVAWCSVAPRSEFPRLDRSPILKPVDDRPVWSIVCLFIDRRHRKRGLSARMLATAARYARREGAQLLEGYPVEARRRTADAFVYTGLASSFLAAGFHEVARRAPTRPIMRLELTRAAGGSRGST